MNPLLRKELRLLMPAWVAAVVAATLPIWLGRNYLEMSLLFFAASVLFVGLAPFGQEMTFGTFSLLLAQPEQRRRLWNIKAGLSALALASAWLVLVVVLISNYRFDRLAIGGIIERNFAAQLVLICGVITLVAYAGGLWTTLLFRDITTAFFATLIAPAALMLATPLVSSHWVQGANSPMERLGVFVLCCYSAAGFWFGRKLFLDAQDVNWTREEVSLGGPLSAPARIFFNGFRTKCGPRWAFARKEWQKQAAALFLVPWLALGHLAAIVARHFYPLHGDVRGCLDAAWILWMIVPLVGGSIAVAQERRLHTHESQLGLPLSAWNQFIIKFGLAMIVGIGLGGVIPSLLESGAKAVGLANQFAGSDLIIDSAAGTALFAFYASTLTNGLLPAFTTALCLAAGFAGANELFPSLFPAFSFYDRTIFICMAWPAMTVVFVWLGCRNSKSIRPGWRLWLANLGWAGLVFASVALLSSAIYNRGWELLLPLEPQHGPPTISGTGHAAIVEDAAGYSVLLPDGQIWRGLRISPGPNLPPKLSGGFIPGSNWVELSGGWQSVAIKSDGTLWDVPGDGKASQIGSDSGWKRVVSEGPRFFALKDDGTLWWWGNVRRTGRAQTVEFPSQPVRIGQESDWSEIFASQSFGQVQLMLGKNDGSFWALSVGGRWTTRNRIEQPGVGLESSHWRSLVNLVGSRYPFGQFLGIRDDGTLWGIGMFWSEVHPNIVRVGNKTDWLQLSTGDHQVAALESNGTFSVLWKNFLLYPRASGNYPVDYSFRMEQLSKYTDWIGVASDDNGTWAVAADGTLCRWQEQDEPRRYSHTPLLDRRPFLRVTRRSIVAINILDSK